LALAALAPAVPVADAADLAAGNAPALCAAARLCGLATEAVFPVALAAAPLAWVVGLLLESPSAVVRFWLMSISCSRLLTCTSWLMYSLGSVSAVGSWFCISVTSKVRKSLADMVAESLPELSELSALPVLAVPPVVVAIGVALLLVNACPAVKW
jgi:hypothetical protein